jgi:hypothetical protein
VRESRPPGSVRGAPGDGRPYRDKAIPFEQGICCAGAAVSGSSAVVLRLLPGGRVLRLYAT